MSYSPYEQYPDSDQRMQLTEPPSPGGALDLPYKLPQAPAPTYFAPGKSP